MSITVSGLMLVTMSRAVTIYYAPNLGDDGVAQWMWLLCAACLPSYHTLDNMDSNPARPALCLSLQEGVS